MLVYFSMPVENSKSKEPRKASTVILTRHFEGDLQVYLLKRSARSDFFPETYVFPGGVVDPDDWGLSRWKEHVDMHLEEISRRLDRSLNLKEALAFGVAAIRETLEEAGVFLVQANQQGRETLERALKRSTHGVFPRGWFHESVRGQGWTLTLSRLSPWAHWITPEIRSIRFDTRFFLLSMPAQQECLPDARETTHGIWISPERGLTGNLLGEIPLSPPTLVTLHELLPYTHKQDLEKHLQNQSWGEARLPRSIPLGREELVLLPWDPLYHRECRIDSAGLNKEPLPVGAPFSRLWAQKGIWRPIGL
jgi:8-oxo-dGTP pyrophosphatase MutT (NUDIX family)